MLAELLAIAGRIEANLSRLVEAWDANGHLIEAWQRGGLFAARTARKRGANGG